MKLPQKIKTSLAVVLATIALAGISHAQLLVNGDFSSNASSYAAYPGYSTTGGNPSAPTGWTVSGDPTYLYSVGLNGSGTGYGGTAFGPGSAVVNGSTAVPVFAFMQGAQNYLSQTFNVTAGLTYVLTYDAATRIQTDSSGAGIIAQIYYGNEAPESGPHLTALYQTSSLTDDQFYANTGVQFTGANSFVAVESGVVTLAFNLTPGSLPPGDYAASVANVSVTQAVPEPSSYALGLIILGVLAFEVRRRSLNA